ncbi:hypothetical protein FB567DRAFT_608125 [Paraphoma chrysanthemicola]|uniref:Uncharacterized protein n=1 Tax=Paraphoma chrysanthemicola TaxID=798071 RepID=A0A8K0QYG8_9PLEO|nr:hypothetical protein FB567DRAFT_608125 [Paraphoma chrysanthemicola]
MSNSVTIQSPLLQLPRELRDRIYSYIFSGYIPFLEKCGVVDTSDENAIFHELPGLCQANRQLFHEATPLFLARSTDSWNTTTSKQLLKLYSHFAGDAATKGVTDISIYNWTEQGTAVQLDLISKFTNLQFLDVVFSFPSIVDGVPMERFNYTNEQGIWWETGLNYIPSPGRSIEEEKAAMSKDLDAFITRYGLDRIIDMPKLNSMQFQFAMNDGGENVTGGNIYYRHRLCNPLWRWAMKKLSEKWGDDEFGVTTTLPEDYDGVNCHAD